MERLQSAEKKYLGEKAEDFLPIWMEVARELGLLFFARDNSKYRADVGTQEGHQLTRGILQNGRRA